MKMVATTQSIIKKVSGNGGVKSVAGNVTRNVSGKTKKGLAGKATPKSITGKII